MFVVRARWLTMLVASTAIVAILAGSSTAAADAKSLQKVQKAAEKTFTTTVTFEGSVETAAGTTTLEGRADYAVDSSELQVENPVGGPATTVRYLVIGGDTVYVGIEAFGGAQLPGAEGKRWVRIDVGALSQFGGIADPSDLFTDRAVFTDAVDAERVGKEKVDGKKAVHYRVALAPDPSDISQATEQDVWIRKGRMVQFRDVTADENEQPVVSTLSITSFGDEVRIEAPPEAEVFDLASVLPR